MAEQNPLQPVFNIIESRKPTPIQQLASLREAQQDLGLQGLEEQRRGITETKEQLAQLQQNAPDPRQQQITRALLAAGDLLSGSGGKASQLYQMFQPKDTAKQQTKLQQLLAQQRQGLSKAELGLLDQQLTGQIREQELALLGQKVAKQGQVDPLDQQLKLARLGKIQQDAEAKTKEQEAAKKSIENVGQILVRDIEDAKQLIDKGGAMTTTYGGIPGLIPGTDANVLRKTIDSVKGNIAVDQLLEIKRQGSGLGQVPQSQLDMLSTLMGNLDPNLPPDILKANLQDVEDKYAEIVEMNGGDPFKLAKQRKNQGTAKEPANRPPAQFKNPAANDLAKELGL